MEKEYDVRITEQARDQLAEIASYIAYRLKEPDTALRLLDTIEEAILSLARFPNRVALTEEEPWHSFGIHKLPVNYFLVYFWVDEETSKVQVTAVVYGKRDQVQQLKQMGME